MNQSLSSNPPSLTWGVDWQNKRIIQKIDQSAAIEQAVFFMLNTQRFRYLIYSDNHGSEVKTLLGQDMDIVESRVSDMIQEALLVDDRITAVDSLKFKQIDSDTLQVTCVVHSIFGDIPIQTEVRR